MAFIDGSVVNVALPSIQNELGASIAAMQWVVNAYLLFLGALVLVGGSMGDKLGRRKVFVAGVAIFMVASAGCGFGAGGETRGIARQHVHEEEHEHRHDEERRQQAQQAFGEEVEHRFLRPVRPGGEARPGRFT